MSKQLQISASVGGHMNSILKEVSRYYAHTPLPLCAAVGSDSSSAETCTVCLEALETDDQSCLCLPCRHVFHKASHASHV